MKKLLLTAVLFVSTFAFMNSAFAVWTCTAMNQKTNPVAFTASMSGPSARHIAATNALQACQASPRTNNPANCYISNCTWYHN